MNRILVSSNHDKGKNRENLDKQTELQFQLIKAKQRNIEKCSKIDRILVLAYQRKAKRVARHRENVDK